MVFQCFTPLPSGQQAHQPLPNFTQQPPIIVRRLVVYCWWRRLTLISHGCWPPWPCWCPQFLGRVLEEFAEGLGRKQHENKVHVDITQIISQDVQNPWLHVKLSWEISPFGAICWNVRLWQNVWVFESNANLQPSQLSKLNKLASHNEFVCSSLH